MSWFRTLISGKPHLVVGPADDPYLLRWYLIPRNRWVNIYLHKFLRDDDDRALHDHPWQSFSILLRGRYIEQTEDGRREFRPGSMIFRSATYRHRILVSPFGRPCWTLFLTGPRIREWGFWCPQGFVVWTKFLDTNGDGLNGPGCEEGEA